MGEYDEPGPDLAIVRPRADFYLEGHPGAADVLLLVEVTETSLVYDQSVETAPYDAAGITEVWVVNLPDGVLEVYRDPGPTGYQDRQTHQRDQRVVPQAFPDLEAAVAGLLPPGRRSASGRRTSRRPRRAWSRWGA